MTQTVPEEITNIVTHAPGIAGALAALVYALRPDTLALHSAWIYAAIWIYGLCALTLYTASVVYHSLFACPRAKKVARRFDHAAIFLMIAGSYTPFLWISLIDRGGLRWSAFIWAIAVVGVIFKLFFAGRFRTLSTLCYLAMGWLAVFLLPDLAATIEIAGLLWLAAGGFAYSVGALFYLCKRLPYQHAIWHVCVLAGSIAQWLSIQGWVLPGGFA